MVYGADWRREKRKFNCSEESSAGNGGTGRLAGLLLSQGVAYAYDISSIGQV